MAHINEQIRSKYFLDALHLFHEIQWLYNLPVTEILTKSVLEEFPEEWINALQALENDELNDFVVNKTTKPHWAPTLKQFTERCKHINRLPVTAVLSSIQLPKGFTIGLSYKKQHEILQLAHLVHSQCASDEIKVIIDLGAGLGYVCQLLYHLYGYQVLGLEKSSAIVNSARNRQRKMYPDSLENVKYDCCDIACDSAEKIESLLQANFEGSQSVCLIGLHACGDLSIHASKIFNDMKAARIFIMISCCYHKLSTSNDTIRGVSKENEYFRYFPISRGLRDVVDNFDFDIGNFLRTPFLRLACQEPADRWCDMSNEAHNEHSFHVLARAVLELYVAKNGYSLKKRVKKGTRKSQCTNFETYLKDSLLRYTIVQDEGNTFDEKDYDSKLEIHEKEIMKLWKSHSDKLRIVEIYSGLQLMLQAPAESLVLQDRLCWFHERNLEAEIVLVTDRSLSPRSYAIVSRKR